MKKSVEIFVFSIVFVLALALMPIAVPFSVSNVAEASNTMQASTREEFLDALARKADVIEAGNIDFAGTTVSINYGVTIRARNGKATFSNVFVKITAPTVSPSTISVAFSDIDFVGGFEASALDLDQTESFETIFGTTRDSYACINADEGYFDLSLSNCSISGYASEVGAVLFVENTHRDFEKRLTIENCKFFGNYSAYDTMHISNDRLFVSLKNSEFYGNHAYKCAGFSIANCDIDIDGVSVHDNFFHPFGINENDPQKCGGGVFIGGVNGTFANSAITNNHTNYGGGLGISPKYAGTGDLYVQNVKINGNTAKFGGAVAAHSISGQPIHFVGCKFIGNSAESGSSLFAVNYGFWVAQNNGGLVEFLFSTFCSNTANDTKTFSFYLADKTKGELGKVNLKGCFVIGDDTHTSIPTDFNYIATKADAIAQGVVSEQDLLDALANGIRPAKGSPADMPVPANVYKDWSPLFADATDNAIIGTIPQSEVPADNKAWVVPVAICVPLGAIAIIAVVLVILFARKKKRKVVDDSAPQTASPAPTIEDNSARLSTLTERERKIVELIIACKKRQEIAQELNYSENTIKKDLSSIYQKLAVSGKSELIARYQQWL